MASGQWNMTSYAQDQEIPLCGEIILLRYPIETIDFKHGPASTLAPTNTSHVYKNISTASNTSTGNYRALKRISIDFFQIFPYSTPPGGVTGDWVPDEWMRQRATDMERLNHLPIPAIDWIPGPSPSPAAPTLSFGGWVNSRHSWLAMVVVRHEFPEIHKVYNLLPFPLLANESSGVATQTVRCSWMVVPVQSTNSMVFSILRFLEKQWSFVTPPSIIANRFILPNYEDVFCGLDGYCGLDTAHSVPPDECDESLTEEDIERALLGIDNIDPSTFWNFPGAPKELREIAQQRVRDAIEEKFFKWSNDCYVGKNDNYYVGEKDDCYVGGRVTATPWTRTSMIQRFF